MIIFAKKNIVLKDFISRYLTLGEKYYISNYKIERKIQGTNYDTYVFKYEDKKFDFDVTVTGSEFNYVAGPAKGRIEYLFQLNLHKDNINMSFHIARIKPNSYHDTHKLNKKTFKKWIVKFISYFSEEVLYNLILMHQNKENNSLMCNTPHGCLYYRYDVFLNERIVFRYNSDYTTHDISHIKKRALEPYKLLLGIN